MPGEEMKREPAYIAIDEAWNGELPAVPRSSARAPIAVVAALGLVAVVVVLAVGRAGVRSRPEAHPSEFTTHPATRSVKRPEPHRGAITRDAHRPSNDPGAATRPSTVRPPRPTPSPPRGTSSLPPPPSNAGPGEFF
jgi:hypothetical protein